MLYIKYYQIFPSNMYAKYYPDMIFVKKFTPPDFQAKQSTPLIPPYFNSFGDKNTEHRKNCECCPGHSLTISQPSKSLSL